MRRIYNHFVRCTCCGEELTGDMHVIQRCGGELLCEDCFAADVDSEPERALSIAMFSLGSIVFTAEEYLENCLLCESDARRDLRRAEALCW